MMKTVYGWLLGLVLLAVIIAIDQLFRQFASEASIELAAYFWVRIAAFGVPLIIGIFAFLSTRNWHWAGRVIFPLFQAFIAYISVMWAWLLYVCAAGIDCV